MTLETPQVAAPRFDPALRSWIVTRYADVVGALRETRLVVAGTPPGGGEAHPARGDGAVAALLPGLGGSWNAACTAELGELLTRIPRNDPVDLLTRVARPWALSLALRATGADRGRATILAALAREVFQAAARATDGTPTPESQEASLALARELESADPALAVQAFVALAETLPGFLAAAWLALLQHPGELERLRQDPALLPRALEELLRFAGPARAVFRVAAEPLSLGGAGMARGDRVILLLAAAHRDPDRYPNPGRLDLRRVNGSHLAFGWGPHACLGGQLVREAGTVATEALLRQAAGLRLAGAVEWEGGYAIRVPAALPVLLARPGPQRAS